MANRAPSRRDTNHEQYLKEKAWFDSNTLASCDRAELKLYQDLIWENPSDVFIKKYDNTVAEMAILCGQENNGWLLSSHIEWLLQKANERSPDCLCLCIPTMSTNTVKEQLKTKDHISRLIFVMNVGKSEDGTVFIATSQQPGNHWVLAIVEFENECVLYCDSLGWNVPSLLCEKLSSYTKDFNLPSFNEAKVVTMHSPSPTNDTHSCTNLCKHYPLQSCTNVCGIVAVVFGVVAALDHQFFTVFVTAQSSNDTNLLLDPSKYERHLRRILIAWFMKEDIDVSVMKERYFETVSASNAQLNYYNQSVPKADTIVDHNYCYQSIPFTKEKAMTENNDISSQPHKRVVYKCPFCSHELYSPQALHYHKKTKHDQKSKVLNARYGRCELCTQFKTAGVKDLIAHYNESHDQKIEICKRSFCNELEFNTWKQKIENESFSQFSLSRGARTIDGITVKYLYCHRSGYSTKLARKRCQKLGSRKIDNKCTAYMVVRINQNDKCVSVEYCLHHTGHSFELGHLQISKEMRSNIAGKLCQGEEVGKILDDIKDTMTDVNRDSLITRKDIHNIRKQYNIFQTEKDKDDSQSVHLWVKEFEKQADNPIIYYKAQNTTHKVLGEEDFLLCIQTDFQRSMLLEQAPRAVYIESTHDTAQYGFSLTTVLVLDEYDKGVPVAWAISNREDSEILQVFIAAIQDSCQKEIRVEIFISDLADSSYNSWCKVFPRPTKRLYCSWHVDNSWRQEITSLVKSETDQCFIYSFLRQIHTEPDESRCRVMLKEFLGYVKEHTPALADYFDQKYVQDDKFCLWGGCFLVGTNLLTEAFQGVLTDLHFEREQNQRVDNLLMALLKVARDRAINQLIKSQKGSISHRLREIKEGHNAAIDVKDVVRSPMEDKWIMTSSTNSDQTNIVEKVLDKKCGCKLVCDSCDICIHVYTCTCHDFLHRSILCKHIHAVQKSLNVVTICTGASLSDNPGVDLDLSTTLIKNEPEYFDDIERVRAEVTSEILKLLDSVSECENIECLKIIYPQIKDSQNVIVINGILENGGTVQADSFLNKKYDSQKRFLTEKKKPPKTLPFKKPKKV